MGQPELINEKWTKIVKKGEKFSQIKMVNLNLKKQTKYTILT